MSSDKTKRQARVARALEKQAYEKAKKAGWRDARLTAEWQRLKGEAEVWEREADK